MIIDGDGHFFETEEMFEKYMEPRSETIVRGC